MAKYRALAPLYVGMRLVPAGEVFVSEDVPGVQWKPLDEEGQARHDDRHASKRNTEAPQPAKPPAKDPQKAANKKGD